MYGRYNNHHKSGRYRTSRSRSISRSKRSPSPMPSKDDRRYSRDRDGRSSSRDRSRCIDYRNSREDRRRYRSRSRSTRRYRSKYSRSKSRSYSPRGRGRSVDKRRSHSRSPLSGRRRHVGSRENPEVSRCLGVFGLSVYTSETQIRQIFSKYGPVERVEVVIDAKTGRSRGFCFVYFENTDDAKVAKENCSGLTIDDRKIRVDYSITQRAHTPTPGVYMGKPTRAYRDKDYERSDRGSRYNSRDDDYYYEKRYRDRRSPSPYYSRRRSSRYDRSRSRSYSPRDRRYR